MIDIQKLREELLQDVEAKIKEAEIQNEFSPFKVYTYVSQGVRCIGLLSEDVEDVKNFLKAFPPITIVSVDTDSDVHNKSRLVCTYTFNGYEVRVKTVIPTELREVLVHRKRGPVGTESSTYTFLHENHLTRREYIDTYAFKHNKEYYGGHHKCTDEEERRQILLMLCK